MWAVVIFSVHARQRGNADRPKRPKVYRVAATGLVLLVNLGSLHATSAFSWAEGILAPALIGGLSLVWLHLAFKERSVPVDGVTVLLVLIVAIGTVHAARTDYGNTKLFGLGITLFCVVMASGLMRTPERRADLLWGTVALGILVAVLSVITPSTQVAAAGRVAAEGATTIATGRMVGSALVVVFALLTLGKVRIPVGAALALGLILIMFETGSRGPLVGALVAGVGILLAAFARRPLRAVGIAAATGGLAWVAWGQASPSSQYRFSLLLSADRGQSVGQREFMMARSWQIAIDQKLWEWRGWGNLNQTDLVYDQDPHNWFLEILVEAGWLAAILLVILLVVAMVRTFRARTTDAAALALLGLLIFGVVNSMVSGNVNDNRPLLTAAVAAWAIKSRPSAHAEDQDEPSEDFSKVRATFRV